MKSLNYRPSLTSSQSKLTGRFLFSLASSFLILTAGAAVLASFVIPGLIPPQTLVRVISSPPPSEVAELPLSSERPRLARPLPQPLLQQPTLAPPPMPSAPVITTTTAPDNTQLLSQSEEALATFELFQEEEAERLKQLQEEAAEAARIAQLKAAEEEAQRKREEEARQLAARAAEQKRAQKAKEAEAHRAVAQKEAQKKAAAAQANRIASAPTVSHRSPPNYPTSARRKQMQGTTRISVTVTSSGKVSSPRIIASSGHSSLDSSALAAVKKWRFNPAKNGLGQPVAAQLTIPFTFRLQ